MNFASKGACTELLSDFAAGQSPIFFSILTELHRPDSFAWMLEAIKRAQKRIRCINSTPDLAGFTSRG